MLAADRERAILQWARTHGSVSVSELAERLDVTAMTVRRDITKLVDAGQLTRVHGGATLLRDDPPASLDRDLLFGVVVPTASDQFPEMIEAIGSAGGDDRVSVALAVSEYDSTRERDLVSDLLRRGVDGILLTTSGLVEGAETVEWLESLPVPTVLLERAVGAASTQLEFVCTDHLAGVAKAVGHLHALGHTRIGALVRTDTPTARPILDALADEVATGGLSVAILEMSGPPNPSVGALAWVAQNALTALLIHTDHDAVNFVLAARGAGVDVPGDLAIIAYDDQIASMGAVPLTAIAPPRAEIGVNGYQMLTSRITRPQTPVRRLMLVPALNVRASCGAVE